MKNLFSAAERMLLDATRPEGTSEVRAPAMELPQPLRKAACDLLLGLNYGRLNSTQDQLLPTSTNETVVGNQLALLALASQFDRAFQLPMVHAPGAAFFGGMISPSSFGIDGHSEAAVGIGGRGATFRQAFESCVGEAAEHLSFLERVNDPLVTTLEFEHGLCKQNLQWALNGIGIAKDTTPEKLDWVEALSLRDGHTVWFPSELALRRPVANRRGRRQSESNGVGAGRTMTDAIYSGLMEVVERDAIGLWWFGANAARNIPKTHPLAMNICEFSEKVRNGSDRRHWFLDLTTDIGIPAVAALSSSIDGRAVVAGFSARIDAQQALFNAFLEMCQMELAQQLSLTKLKQRGREALTEQDLIWIERFENLSVKNYPSLQGTGIARDHHDQLTDNPLNSAIEKLSENKLQPFFVNLTRSGIDVPVARILVPGLQSVNRDWISERLSKLLSKTNTLHTYPENSLSPI